MTKKNPIVAAVFGFIFGPFGYLYIGWGYAVMAFAVFAVFTLVLTLTNFPLPSWIKFVTLGVLAWKGFTICSVRNEMIEMDDPDVALLNTFPLAAMAMSDLLVGMGIGYAAAIGLYAAAKLILEGSVFIGIFTIFIGTPVLVWIGSMVFGIIALGMDALFVAGAENLFRVRDVPLVASNHEADRLRWRLVGWPSAPLD